MNKKLKLLCYLLLMNLSFANGANASLAQCQGFTSRPPNLPSEERQLQHIPEENKLRIRTIVTVIHKDGTRESEEIDQKIPFDWRDFSDKGISFDQAMYIVVSQYLTQVKNNICIIHGCFKNLQ